MEYKRKWRWVDTVLVIIMSAILMLSAFLIESGLNDIIGGNNNGEAEVMVITEGR